MLRSIGVRYVILGHSERRQYFNESEAWILEKMETALKTVYHQYIAVENHLRFEKRQP